MLRKIIHIDMDAFYASVEQRDHPALRGQCIAVGGSAERGVVATASYEARRYGVKSAMPSVVAKRKCPKLIFVKPRFDVYQQVSQEIRDIFYEYTDLVEPLSLDEAYLDVTENKKGMGIATDIAKEILQKIYERTQLTASAGISYNKFLAKIASDYRKPHGMFVVTPKMALDFVAELPIRKFHGIGKVTAERMSNMGIHNGYDLRQLSLEKLLKEFGKSGQYYYQIARGEDYREVNATRIRKSVGSENTFTEDLTSLNQLQQGIIPEVDDVWRWCSSHNVYGRTVTVKIKYSDFSVVSKSKTLIHPLKNELLFRQLVMDLMEDAYTPLQSVRLLGVSVSNLTDYKLSEGRQLEINFEPTDS